MIRIIETSPLQIMRILLIFLLIGSLSLQAQNKSGITGKPDTSFTNYAALQMVVKQDPTIRLADYQSTKSKEQSSNCWVRGADISWMNKKRGGSLFFMPYLYSLLYTLYSIS